MGRRKTHALQTAIVEVDTRPRPLPAQCQFSYRTMELGRYVGLHRGKNVFIDLCDRCHEPGIRLGERWYHEEPCDNPCVLSQAPRPALDAMVRLLKWYQWAQKEARAHSSVEIERAGKLEALVFPMTPYLLSQIARPDRRNLPTVSECRMIRQAMANTVNESWQDPLELEAWTAK